MPSAGGVTSAPAGTDDLGVRLTSCCLHLPAQLPPRWVASSEAQTRLFGPWKSPLVLCCSLDPERHWLWLPVAHPCHPKG